jgi:capsular polysaccharide biosynthesis protein
MRNASEGLEFARYLRRRWALIAISCATAVVVAGAVSLLLPARYTATSSILIEPPGGNDPRAATAVSTVYLESLKTYERFASSDTLFEHALNDLHLRERYPGASTDTLKRRILEVTKPASTTIIDISATVSDPKDAQMLAQYMAEHTVALNASLERQTDEDLSKEPQRLFDAAKARRAAAESAKDLFTKTTPVEALDKEVLVTAELRSEVGKDLARSRAELANYVGQQQAPQPSGAGEPQAGWTQFEIVSTRSKIQDLENQDRQLLQALTAKSSILENLRRERDALDAELKSARADEEAENTKLSDVKSTSAARGVRLKVLDPGIVPQRPSFPNPPVNVGVAFALSLMASIGYLAMRFSYDRVRDTQREPIFSRHSDALR